MATAATGYSPLATTADPTTALLTQLLGQRQSQQSNTLGQTAGSQAGTNNGTNTGSTTGTTTSTANLDPLLQSFSQNIGGMDVDSLKALIQGIFTEGAQAVPALTAQYANSTGSRVSGNSGLQLALGDLNKNLSTQAVQAMIQGNNQSQATAANAASQIAANTRQTAQTGTTQAATQQATTQQSGQTAQTNGAQTTKTGVNPSSASLLGLGGTALNFLDKKGLFNNLFGSKTPAGGVGTIAGGNSNTPAPVLTNGGEGATSVGGSSFAPAGSAPATSLGAYQVPTTQAAAPAIGGGGANFGSNPIPAGGGFSQPGFSDIPSMDLGSSGISSFLGSSGSPGLGGFGGGLSFGDVGSNASNVFGTASTGSLGDNLSFGSNPFGYAGSGAGITGAVGAAGDAGGGFSSLLSGAGDWLSNAAGGVSDWVGSLFANGGMIGGPPMIQPRTYSDQGYGTGIPSRLNFANGGMPCYPGTNMDPNISGSWLNPSEIGRSLAGPGGGYIDGIGYADGGMLGALGHSMPPPNRYFADGGGIGAVGDGRYGAPTGQQMRQVQQPMGNIWDTTRARDEVNAGLRDPRQAGGPIPVTQARPGQDPAMTGANVMQLIPFLVQQMLGFANGGQVNGNFTGSGVGAADSFFADGGQVADAQVDRRRNVNYMGQRKRPDQATAENYDGYSSDPAAGVGSSQPAGGSPSLSSPGAAPALLSSTLAAAPAGVAAMTPEAAAYQQQLQVNNYNNEIIARLSANEGQNQAAAARAAASQSAGTDGATSSGSDTAGTPGGIGSVGSGVTSGIGAAASLGLGMSTPIGMALSVMAALSNTIQGAIAAQGGTGVDGLDGTPSASNSSADALGLDPSSVPEGNGGPSAGDSNSGDSPGDGAGGSAWANGGLIKGPGTGTSDSIPATLDGSSKKDINVSTDEFIMPADVVAMFGPQHFQRYIDTFHTPA